MGKKWFNLSNEKDLKEIRNVLAEDQNPAQTFGRRCSGRKRGRYRYKSVSINLMKKMDHLPWSMEQPARPEPLLTAGITR